jgi:hypothetical protein
MTRGKKRVLPGSQEVTEELHIAKFRLALACRLIQFHVREATHLVKQCERYGSVSSFNHQINENVLHILLSLQDVTRAGNTARRALKRFHNTIKGE